MSSTVLYMSMSLDGFVAGPNETPDNGLGDGGDRLHQWAFPGAEDDFEAAVGRPRGVNRRIYDEFMSTGALVAGRQTFEPAGGWGGDHHDGVPIYILAPLRPFREPSRGGEHRAHRLMMVVRTDNAHGCQKYPVSARPRWWPVRGCDSGSGCHGPAAAAI